MTRPVFIFVNGVRVNPEGVDDWQDQAVRWVGANVPHAWADRFEYETLASTRFLGQSRRVDELFALIQSYRIAYGANVPIVIGAHSNGCAIALDCLRLHPGLLVNELHLFAAAADANFQKNRLNDVLLSGYCNRVTCYCSKDDGALKLAGVSRFLLGWMGLGYGDLGRVGPKNVDPKVADRVVTHWYDGFGHSDYFTPQHFDATMRAITGKAA